MSAATNSRGQEPPSRCLVYFGTYTQRGSEGIYACAFDVAKKAFGPVELAAEAVNPSFLAVASGGAFLYAVSEIEETAGEKTGGVAAFRVDKSTGRLQKINEQPSKGAGPCHLVVDATNHAVLVANYGGGSVAALAVKQDGGLAPSTSWVQHAGSSVNPARQEGPHAHSINLAPDNRFAFAADLGLDKVLVYGFDPQTAALAPHDPPYAPVAPGAGPRHFAFEPKGRYAYVINELDSTITAFRYDELRGALTEIETVSTLPERFDGTNYTADIHVHPSGKFVYGSNRGHDSLAVFAIDQDTGRLSGVAIEPTQGKTPRNFGIEPGGRYLLAANQDSDTVVAFAIDPERGTLRATGDVLNVPMPVCVQFVPVE